ncbi:MAG TPA: PaaI family thioesterase [Xanthobacteraceae bacterium]|nr:PaaI family thioesterase [Xanthobacteraceae bacterium]
MTDVTPEKFGLVLPEVAASISGLELLQGMIAGRFPGPPIMQLIGFRLSEVEKGRAVFTGTPAFEHYNPLGTVHGGYAATLLDSCMGCSVHTTLPKGVGYTTLEFKVSLVRAITADTGPVRAEGKILTSGRRVATAEGRLIDAADRLLAHATTTCLVFEVKSE